MAELINLPLRDSFALPPGFLPMERKCTRCGEVKLLMEFHKSQRRKDGLQLWCRVCNNRAACDWVKANRQKARERSARWRKKNYDRFRRTFNEARKLRMAKRPELRVLASFRTRFHDVLNGVTKADTTLRLVGCSLQELKAKLESQFKPGMTWENYGSVWHVDHIRPCISFDFTKPEQQRACFHHTNLQPLFASENLSKGTNE